MPLSPIVETEPSKDCPRCPRLVALRHACRAEHPDWWNGPVRAFGDPAAWLAIIGLAPGKQGANRTGRPFTGDFAGDLLFATLERFGLANDGYRGHLDDNLRLNGAIILNAVKCLPPQNRPLPDEIANCRPFLEGQLSVLPGVRTMIALGAIAHGSVLRIFGMSASRHRFAHGAIHTLPDGRRLIDSYHCSRYNQNTGRLTQQMFEQVFVRALEREG
jgi:uracil-DNA glycosylase family 4